MWKERKGNQATYNNLIRIFEDAGHQQCADFIRHNLTFGKCRSSLILMQALSLSPTFVYAIGKRVEEDSSVIVNPDPKKGTYLHVLIL